jgi:nucleoside-diphosphate-sugar epimerase
MSAEQSIVVLGGTGFIGEALARQWTPQDQQLIYLVHRSAPSWLDEFGLRYKRVDLGDPSSIAAAVDGSSRLINLLRPLGDGWYPRMLDVVLPTMRSAGVVRCVHASSIDVYNGSPEARVTANTPIAPRNAYENEHADAEQRFSRLFPEPAILRLGAVFGPGGKNVVHLAKEMANSPYYQLILKRFLHGKRRMHLVSLPTVCGALEAAVLTERLGAVINVTDDSFEENNFSFVQDMLAKKFGRKALSGTTASPAFALDTALRLRGLSPVVARRRFDSDGLDRIESRRGDFVTEMEHYVNYLGNQWPDRIR